MTPGPGLDVPPALFFFMLIAGGRSILSQPFGIVILIGLTLLISLWSCWSTVPGLPPACLLVR